MGKPLPTHAELVDYKHAVAGHDGTLCDVDGTLFIKPCTQAEVDFYQVSVVSHPEFYEFMPTFLGVLSLDETAPTGTIEEQCDALLAIHASHLSPIEPNQIPIAKRTVPEVVPIKSGRRITTNQAIVLENAASGFVKPNILDVKLGVRLYADDAKDEKKARFDKVTEETTHKTLGFRIAGMRVWQGEGATGKDIDDEGYKVYDKNFGRLEVTEDNIEEAFANFIFSHSAGIDEDLGRLICQAFLTDCRRVQEVLENQESRMFSASLLFVFEGDGVALRAAMEEASNPKAVEVDEDSDDDGAGPKIYAVHVIDFAHATWTPGEGPDENSLVGVRSVVKILDHLGQGHKA